VALPGGSRGPEVPEGRGNPRRGCRGLPPGRERSGSARPRAPLSRKLLVKVQSSPSSAVHPKNQSQEKTPLPSVSALLSNAQPSAASTRSRRAVPPPRGGGSPLSWEPGLPAGCRGPPAGSRDGDRAPPRGVDVKQPLRGGPGRASGAPGRGLGLPAGSRGPGSGKWPFPGPWTARAPRRPPRRRGFYINPSRRGPVPGSGLGDLSGSPGPETRDFPETPKNPEKRGF